MTGSDSTRSKHALKQRLLNAVPACHTIGAVMSVALLVTTLLVWRQGSSPVAKLQHGDRQVDLREAALLINNAQHWRNDYTRHTKQSEIVDRRVADIGKWLPRNVNWSDDRRSLETLIDDAGLKLVSIEEGLPYTGSRVGVTTVTCRIEGTFHDICQLLVALPKADHPIGCHAISLTRGGLTPDRPSDAPCTATLSLRLPFAADGSLAAGLLPQEDSDG